MERRKPRSRGMRVGAAIAATAVVATTLGAAALIRSDDDDDDSDASDPVELTGEARELASLLERREGATYHATYEGTGPNGAQLVVESWQAVPRARQDQRISNAGDTLQLSTFVLPEGRSTCLKIEEQDWTCRQGTQSTSADPLETIRARIGEGVVTAEDATVEGRDVRCYTFTVDDETNELCLVPESGIPVRIRGGETELVLTGLEDDVEEGVFALPAEVATA